MTLTIAPAFFSAAIYLSLARIVNVYGQTLSRFQPRTYTITFMVADFIALFLQAAGAVIAGGNDMKNYDKGAAVLKAGLGFHLAAMVVFIFISADFAYSVSKNRGSWNPKFHDLQNSRGFHAFVISRFYACPYAQARLLTANLLT